MDGPAKITQDPIENGHVYRYEFTAVQSGTYFYHSHDHVDRQQSLGLYGAMIIEPKEADPTLRAGLSAAARNHVREFTNERMVERTEAVYRSILAAA